MKKNAGSVTMITRFMAIAPAGFRSLASGAAAPCQQPENTTDGNTAIVMLAMRNFLWMKERIALSILESDKGEEK